MEQECTASPGTATREGVRGRTPTIPEVEVEAGSQEGTLGEGMEGEGTGVQTMDSTIDTQRAIIGSTTV